MAAAMASSSSSSIGVRSKEPASKTAALKDGGWGRNGVERERKRGDVKFSAGRRKGGERGRETQWGVVKGILLTSLADTKEGRRRRGGDESPPSLPIFHSHLRHRTKNGLILFVSLHTPIFKLTARERGIGPKNIFCEARRSVRWHIFANSPVSLQPLQFVASPSLGLFSRLPPPLLYFGKIARFFCDRG